MALIHEMEKQGNWLFRWRGIFPVLLVPFLLLAVIEQNPLKTLLEPEPWESWWLAFSMLVSFSGFVVRCLVIGFVPSGTSGRNTLSQRAEQLNTSGFYSLVRHPLYFGNFLIALGIVLQVKSPWFLLMFLLAYALYYERIMFAEEGFLREKFGEEFKTWSARTPAFIPAFRKMEKPDLTFSLRMLFRREYPAFLLIGLSFLLIDFLEEKMVEHEAIHPALPGIFLFCLTIAWGLRTLKKKTTLLKVMDR